MFTNQYTRDKKLIQYIFESIENHYRKTNELKVNNFSLEHIDPQTNQNVNYGWIGNLLPLDKLLNEKCKDYTYQKKIPIYKNSDLKIVEIFLLNFENASNWGIENQNKWFNLIVEKSYNEVWKLDQ